MVVFGLTGGVGMGKSTAAQLLSAWKVPVTDTDTIAREIVEPGQPALAEIGRLFGGEFIAPDGRLRRDALAQRVFGDSAAREDLERLLHPCIRARWHAQVSAWRAQGCPIAIVVIPLLFETQAEAELTKTICVACSSATQYRRLQERGWSSEHTQQRIQSQWPVEKKMALADYVIWTESGLDVHAAQWGRILSHAGFSVPRETGDGNGMLPDEGPWRTVGV